VGVDFDFDLVNENFDVLGLRLDILLSISRICCLISSLPYSSFFMSSNQELTVSYERSSYAGNEDIFSRN